MRTPERIVSASKSISSSMLGGTFAVSFLLSAEAIAGTPATDGAFGADGIAVPGGFGASGGTPDLGTPATEGGFGATGAMEGGLGAGGATPEIEGGLGAAGGADSPTTGGAFGAKEGSPDGLGTGGNAGGSPAETDSGAPGFCIGLGGRLIIAVSRGFDASG